MSNDTIVAIATGTSKGGIGIVRLSGSLSLEIAEKISGRHDFKPRTTYYGSFYTNNKEVIDEGISLYFKRPNSFTGEDVVEFQAHGSTILLDIIVQQCVDYGARLARPGEFSERAFLNDKIDLVQAEAIADIIDSSSKSAAKNALKSLKGEFSKAIDDLVLQIIELRMYVEAALDFPEEEIDFVGDGYIAEKLDTILNDTIGLNNNAYKGSVLQNGFNAIIIGKPNTGKSSLLNFLSREDVAIVSDIAGTTRDVLKQNIQLGELTLNLIDTAGLRSSDDEIEQLGIAKIRKEISTADIVVFLREADQLSQQDDFEDHLRKEIQAELEQHRIELPPNALLLVLNNKIDLLAGAGEPKDSRPILDNGNLINLSIKNQLNTDEIEKSIRQYFKLHDNDESLFSARRRHLDILQSSQEKLIDAKKQFNYHHAGELLAQDLRDVQELLGEITGKISSDELLGEIFSNFCIGK